MFLFCTTCSLFVIHNSVRKESDVNIFILKVLSLPLKLHKLGRGTIGKKEFACEFFFLN